MSNRDRPSTWVAHKPALCASCEASCCRLPVEVRIEDFLRLGLISADEAGGSVKKVAKRLMRERVVRSYRVSTGLFLLEPKSDGSCPFLGSDHECTVYEKRPGVCRQFPLELGPRVGFCPYKRKIASRL